ncbi:DNA adenine methylase [Micromonospora sp. NPDC049171]|uniref:DNA adenine methylase n=1 Tax=Micromonospora sp. NPDC049171 TaxID=3155770 RepID=UPI0033E77FB8
MLDKPDAHTDPAFFRQAILSPLRYPGAKRQLVPIIKLLIGENVPTPRLFVEPFCGGASTTLHLLGAGVVDHAILADVDPLVSAFWKTAAFDSNWIVDAIAEEPVTVSRWDWWRDTDPKTTREKALKCIFLNRTTFSGILHGRAGPIGGRAQSSPYKIDCRFGLPGLTRRIKGVADLAATGRLIDVWESDWRDTISRIKSSFTVLSKHEIMMYLDPPYVDKAQWLYQWSFESAQHGDLATILKDDFPFRWILSYDDNDHVRQLYSKGSGFEKFLHVPNRYTAAGSEVRNTKSELLVTNLPRVPDSEYFQMLALPE